MLIYFLKQILKGKSKKENRFQLFSIHRYFRYIKIIFNRKVIIVFLVSSMISNTILQFQEYRYEHLYREENIKVEGVIVSNKEEREYANRYQVNVLTVNDLENYKHTRIYISVKKDIDIKYGDSVILEGTFSKGSEQRNYGGFHYQLYLKSIHIYGTVDVENIQKISSNNTSKLEKYIHDIKLCIGRNIENTLSPTHSQIVKGLVLGDTTNLEENLMENFRIANISHILAVSGTHIVYIAIGIEFGFKKIFGKRKTKYLTILGLVFYMSLTGLTSSIVRAGIMGIMSMVAFLLYRKKDIWCSIAISLIIILIENPYAITRNRVTIILSRYNRHYCIL